MQVLEVTPSYINDIMLCARLYYYQRVRNLVPIGGNSEKMDRGTYLHHLLEVYYNGLLENFKGRDPMWTSGQLIEKAFEEKRVEALKPEMNVSPEMLVEVEYQFREYVDHYRSDALIPIAVEKPFTKLLFRDEELQMMVIVSGRLDLVAAMAREPEQAIIFDHKSRSQRVDSNVIGNQPMGYCWATGIRTFCMNSIGFQKTVARKDRMMREVWRYNVTQLKEWEGIATYWTKLMFSYERDGIFPPNFTSCDKFAHFGGGGCKMREICATIPEAREHKLRVKFVEGPSHDPYKRT